MCCNSAHIVLGNVPNTFHLLEKDGFVALQTVLTQDEYFLLVLVLTIASSGSFPLC